MTDRTQELLAELEPALQPAALYLINAYRNAGYPCVITEARRTLQRQQSLYNIGRSLISGSALNLVSGKPVPKHYLGRAFDIAFVGIAPADTPVPWYEAGGQLWEAMGGTWGGRWTTLRDYGHFEA